MSLKRVSVAALILVAVSGGRQAAEATRISIPLDQADKRFGKLYVKSFESLLYRPSNDKPAPTIVFMHGCGGIGGLTLDSAEKYGRHFQRLGHATLILEPFDERKLRDKPCSDRNTSFSLLDARRADLDAAAQWLVANKMAIADRIVVLGTSHGGEVAIEHDQREGGTTTLAGAIAFYPGCDRGTPFARHPLLVLVGDKDFTDGPRRSLGAICSDYVKAANGAGGAKADVVVYPDAAHSFDVEGVRVQVSQSLNKSVSGYQPAAAKASGLKIDEFLAKVLK